MTTKVKPVQPRWGFESNQTPINPDVADDKQYAKEHENPCGLKKQSGGNHCHRRQQPQIGAGHGVATLYGNVLVAQYPTDHAAVNETVQVHPVGYAGGFAFEASTINRE